MLNLIKQGPCELCKALFYSMKMGKDYVAVDYNLLDKDQTISFHLQPFFVRKLNFDKMFEIVFRSYFVFFLFNLNQIDLLTIFFGVDLIKKNFTCLFFEQKMTTGARKKCSNVRIFGHQMNI